METYEINYREDKVIFSIERKNVKNVNINIRITGQVIVTAKEEVPLDFIIGFVQRKASWIISQNNYYRAYESKLNVKKELVSGETIKYLGKQYRLKIEESEHEHVKYFRGYIFLYVKDKNNYRRKEELLDKWFEERFRDIVNKLYNKNFFILKKYNVPSVIINIRKMRTRWGSCSVEKQRVLLNKDLIKAPKYCIEYVILHELIHLIYTEHNREFYDFLYVLMPDWKERKRILDEEVVLDL
ncbi:SprT family zinc-dependent metalloprotease [Clostridium subterminale]|uniref:SprT family zinc-dependent metalloprotease n=1 Tax=Clostridium subterminale TaxID=1550 RepID=A0ABP3W6C2_CLOSU